MMTETPVREMMQDEIDRLTREVERLTNREAAADELAADALAEVERLRAVIAERDEHGRKRTAEGLRERNRAAKAEKDAAIYKDAFKDATMANTVAAQKLAEQEAKTVEYRAAWIKATRERDEYRKLLREERDGRRILELEAGWVEADR